MNAPSIPHTSTETTYPPSPTDRAAAAENDSLAACRRKLRLLLEGGELGTWKWSRATGQIEFGSDCRTLFGFDPEENPTATDFLATLRPCELDRFREAIGATANESGLLSCEIRLKTPTGRTRWLSFRGESDASTTSGPGGEVHGIVHDITESKLTDLDRDQRAADLEIRVATGTAKLEATNARLDAVLNAATSVAIIATDARGIINVFSHGAEIILGYSASEVLGRLAFQDLVAARQSEEYAPGAAAGFEYFLELAHHSDRLEREWTMVRKGGDLLPVSLLVNPLHEETDQPHGIVAIVRDVSEHRVLEERLRLQSQALESAENAVVITDSEGQVQWVNPAFTRLTGYRIDEVQGRTMRILRSGSHTREFFAGMWRTIRAGRVWRGELLNRRKDGSTYFEEMTITPVRAKSGEISHYIAIKQEVTHRKRQEVMLREAMRAAEQAAQAKSEFLAMMSHEIRTPMNGVIGMSRLLLDTELGADQQRYATTIHKCADTLLSIINQILDFSKAEAGRLELEAVDFDLRTVVEDTVEMLATRAREREVELISQIDARTPMRLRGDPGRLRQVLLNLINNAIKFTERGDVCVRVKAAEVSEGGVTLCISVEDTGIGIPSEVHERLFRPFVQADSSTTRRYGGTGLGLAICRQIVALMHGEFNVTSEPGRGSTFRFTARFDRQPSTADNNEPDVLDVLADQRVLLVDDNPTRLHSLLEELRSRKMRPANASSPEEVLAELRAAADQADPFHVLLVDGDIPGVDALGLIRTVKQEPILASTNCILVTRVGESPSEAVLRETGVSGIATKPIRSRILARTITASLSDDYPVDSDEVHAAPGIGEAAPVGPRLKILFAEDNTVNQMVGVDQLAKLGLEADVVADGAEAVDALRRIPYDVVLMDCMMPEMDGYQAARRIRELERERLSNGPTRAPVRIIAMTANALAGEREKCLAAGMDDYVAKPVDIQDLRRALSAGMNTRCESDRDSPTLNLRKRTEPTRPDESRSLVDLNRLREVTSSGSARSKRLIDTYLTNAEQTLRALSLAIEHDDVERVATLAHRWAGSSGTCGLVLLMESLRRLEALAKGGTLDGAADLLGEIQTCFEESRGVLVKHARQHSTYQPAYTS